MHHADLDIDVTTGLRFHPIEIVLLAEGTQGRRGLVGLQFVRPMAQDAHYDAVRKLLRRIAAQEDVMIVRRYEAWS